MFRKNNTAIAYCRLSAKKCSGYTPINQLDDMADYVKENELEVIKVYNVVQSATNFNKQSSLKEAIDFCQKNKAKLLFSEVDRFSRDVRAVNYLSQSGIKWVCTQYPHFDLNDLRIRLSFYQEDAERRSRATKNALARLKKKGVLLGASNPKIYRALQKSSKKGNPHLKNKAQDFAKKMKVIIEPLLRANMSKTAIVDHLNAFKVPTAQNCKWSRKQLYRVLDKVEF